MANFTLNKSIVLVGLMGAGKSSVGKKLSEEIGVPFVDSDEEIELAAGMSISEIFEQFGEPYFRAGEERVIKRLLLDRPKVIATGGGAFISNNIQTLIRQGGVSIWLNADFETLWERVQGKRTRPLLRVVNPEKTLKRLIRERTPIYEQANITLYSKKNGTHFDMVLKLIESLSKYGVLERCDD